MKTVDQSIKLTSKNQLTVPAHVARKLHLSAGDHLDYELRGGALILKPRPSLSNQLEVLWSSNSRANKGVASDDSIRKTLGDYHKSHSAKP